MRQLFGILLAGCFFLLGAGCSDDAGRVGAVRILSGLGQSAAPGEKFDAPLTVECLTGEDGEPAPDRPVRVEPLPGSDLLLEETRFRTDAGGVIRIPVAAGNRVGDHYLRVVPEDAPSQAVEVRFVTGVRISGGGQEGPSGRRWPNRWWFVCTIPAGFRRREGRSILKRNPVPARRSNRSAP